jgi:HlyD family secretion protein
LHEEDSDFISETEMDQYRFNLLSLKAQLRAAEAAVEQAKANLQNSAANLGYTEIKSPVDGIVIDRKIEPGQTLAAQFQTPVLFVIAPEMEKKMHVFASVDETDIGLIRDAKRRGQSVRFTVDAYPDDLFDGEIEQIRISSTTTQNVVTYPVVVAAPNPDLKLLPGMTASLSFQIEEKEAVLKIPNAAFWFYPTPEQVRPEDRQILEGAKTPADEDAGRSEVVLSATEKAEARRRRNRRHVWVVAGEHLKAVEVVTGLSDNQHTELVSGPLDEGQKLVAGTKPKENGE